MFWNHTNCRVFNYEAYVCKFLVLILQHLFTELFHKVCSSVIIYKHGKVKNLRVKDISSYIYRENAFSQSLY